MDRNAVATPPPEVQQTAPLLVQHPDDDPDDNDFHDDEALLCWCCPMYRCLFGGCTGGKNAQPFATRTLDCAAHFLFWFSGMYQPGGTFRRNRWDMANDLNLTRAGKHVKRGVISRDASVPSTKVPDLRIPIRIYEPIEQHSSDVRDYRVMLFFHGGGFCIGSAAMANFDDLCIKFCSKLQIVVVSVSYRLAPEHPFPAAVHDCHDVMRWIFATPPAASGLSSLFPTGAMVPEAIVAGDSAGGNLACVMASLARDGLDGELQPCPVPIRISRQVLIYPALFMHRMVEEDFVDVSAFLPKPVTHWFMLSYMPENKKSRRGLESLALTDRRLSPLVAGFQGMPPVILISAGLDHLRHENRIAVQQFKMSGVDVVHRHVEHVPHGFVTFHFLRESKETIDNICQDLLRPVDKATHLTASDPAAPAKDIVLGKMVEIIGCMGARGTVREVRPCSWMDDEKSPVESALQTVGGKPPVAASNQLVAVIDMTWGKAYCPLTNIIVLN